MKFARVLDGAIAEIIVVPANSVIDDMFHPDFVAALVAHSGNADVGWRYEAGQFLPPPPVEIPPAAPPRLSFIEFMDLFTEDEMLSIKRAAMSDPEIGLWYDRAVGAQFIDLGDARLKTGMQKLVDAKLISASRRSRVLSGAPLA